MNSDFGQILIGYLAACCLMFIPRCLADVYSDEEKEFGWVNTPRRLALVMPIYFLSSPLWVLWQVIKGFVQMVRWLWVNESFVREESNSIPCVQREPAARGRKIQEKE